MTAPGPRRRLLRVAALGVSVSRCEMLRDSVKGRARERAKHVCVILGSCSCRVFGSRSTFSRSRTLARCCPTRPALPRSATRAHVWPTHARAVFLPAGRCGLEAALGLVVPSARPAWFPAPRPRLPRRRPPPLLAPWPPLPVAFGSPPSDSQRWAFSEPPVPFPRPGPRAPGRPVGPARASLAHTPPPAVWRLSQRTNVALLHLTPEVAS